MQLGRLAELLADIDRTAYWKGATDEFDHDALVTMGDGNRWNDPGEPTLYLTGDPGLALIEAGRHEPAGPPAQPSSGTIWALRVSAPDMLDLRRLDVREALGLDGPHWFLDRPTCQRLVRSLRQSGACSGIVTQSAGVPDIPERWNLVIFADRLDRPVDQVVSQPKRIGSFQLGAVDAIEASTVETSLRR